MHTLMARDDDAVTVYTSEQGRIYSKGKSGAPEQTKIPQDGIVRVSRSTKGRKGKGVTIITGLPLDATARIAKQLKQKCGSGGTIRNGVIEIQGDHRTAVMDELRKQGFTVKLAGG